jgi:aminoglycoside phosphotransferase
MSLDWNYAVDGQERGDRGIDTSFEGELLDAYGVMPDTERMAYYRRVWD